MHLSSAYLWKASGLALILLQSSTALSAAIESHDLVSTDVASEDGGPQHESAEMPDIHLPEIQYRYKRDDCTARVNAIAAEKKAREAALAAQTSPSGSAQACQELLEACHIVCKLIESQTTGDPYAYDHCNAKRCPQACEGSWIRWSPAGAAGVPGTWDLKMCDGSVSPGDTTSTSTIFMTSTATATTTITAIHAPLGTGTSYNSSTYGNGTNSTSYYRLKNGSPTTLDGGEEGTESGNDDEATETGQATSSQPVGSKPTGTQSAGGQAIVGSPLSPSPGSGKATSPDYISGKPLTNSPTAPQGGDPNQGNPAVNKNPNPTLPSGTEQEAVTGAVAKSGTPQHGTIATGTQEQGAKTETTETATDGTGMDPSARRVRRRNEARNPRRVVRIDPVDLVVRETGGQGYSKE